jgi:preprotein translocase SecE subunit
VKVEANNNDKLERAEKTGGSAAVAAGAEPGGFFTIHRRGQGKWTRIGTAIASGMVVVGSVIFISGEVGANAHWDPRTSMIVAAAFAVVVGALAFWLQNKPSNVAFLIDTDSEMKKVNWTSRKELIGSTKIVIGFMVIMALMLFVVDILFGEFFYLINVLKFSPIGQ